MKMLLSLMILAASLPSFAGSRTLAGDRVLWDCAPLKSDGTANLEPNLSPDQITIFARDNGYSVAGTGKFDSLNSLEGRRKITLEQMDNRQVFSNKTKVFKLEIVSDSDQSNIRGATLTLNKKPTELSCQSVE